MKRNRLLVLSSVALLASGAILFACSGGDDDVDSGTDASKTDAKTDGTTTQDAKADQTVADTGTDTGNDATLSDATADADDSSTTTDAGTDADDGGVITDASTDAITDASTDGGTVVTFMVLRVGGSSDPDAGADAALSNVATQSFLEERNVSDGSLVRVLTLPTSVDAGNEPLTLGGTATSEGSLTRSADTHYVVVGGYGTAPGVPDAAVGANTAFDAGVPRVVARVDKNGNIDTTTQLNAFNKTNIRGVASNDGTSFWATGAANDGTQYVALGSTGTTTNLQTTLLNERVVQIFGGQVYVSSSSGAFHGVSTVGTGLPTTTGQTVTLLPGMPVDAGSAYGFSMLDLDASVSGLDTLYIADDTGTTGGVQKWVFNGTTWTKVATFNDKTTTGFRGLTAYFDGANVVLLGTTGDSTNPNTVVKYVDDGINTPTGTVLATAPTNCAFRGFALSPQ